MNAGEACTLSGYDDLEGGSYERVRYGQERRFGQGRILPTNCHDCRTPLGAWHHPGCDVEECPRCGGQAIACDCEVEDEADGG